MRAIRRIGRVSLLLVAGALGLGACSGSTSGGATQAGTSSDADSSADSLTTITVGFNSGPYEQMFTEGIEPILESEGYTLKTQSFSDGIQVNQALNDGEIQANIMQHQVYLDYVNQQRGFSNVSLVQVPGPPMGLFAGKSDSPEPADGASVALPNEPSNLYRALLLLQDAGWITVSESIDSGTASLNDVTSNPHDLKLTLLENSQAVRSLEDLDYAVVQGNFVVSAGLDLTSAIKLEDLQDEFSVIVAVADGNTETAWAKAIVEAYQSQEFADYIHSNSQYDGYHLPSYMDSE